MDWMENAFFGFAQEEENKNIYAEEMESDIIYSDMPRAEFVEKWADYVGYYYAKDFYDSLV